jgi:hypothetical protein
MPSMPIEEILAKVYQLEREKQLAERRLLREAERAHGPARPIPRPQVIVHTRRAGRDRSLRTRRAA